jgi:hypothetical protein
MSLTFDKFEGAWTVAANTHGFKIDGGSFVYLPAATYYWSSGVDAGASLLSAIATLISGTVASTTATLDDSTGKLTIHFGSGDHSLDSWTTTFRNLCGFDADAAPDAHTFTSTNQVQRLWLPDHGPSEFEGAAASIGKRVFDRKIFVARNGAQFSRRGSDWYERNYTFRYLTAKKIWEGSEVTVNESFESFLEDCFLSGPIRHYTDRTDDNSYLVGSVEREYVLADFREYNPRRSSKVDDLWDLSFACRQYIEA